MLHVIETIVFFVLDMQEEDIIECMLMSGVMVHTNVQILIVNKSHNRVSDIIR